MINKRFVYTISEKWWLFDNVIIKIYTEKYGDKENNQTLDRKLDECVVFVEYYLFEVDLFVLCVEYS